MSTQRQSSDADRRSPIRKAVPTKDSASGPDDRIASARNVAHWFREDCRTLRDSLQLEMVVAQYHLQMRDVLTPQGAPVGDATGAAVIAELERHGDALSHAILRGLEHLGTGETVTRSAGAIARLAGRGIGLPPKFADVAGARPLAAWRTSEGGHDGEYVLFADFEHAQGTRHALALFVEPRHGGVVKHIGLMNPMSDLDAGDAFHPSALEPMPIATAGELLHELLDRSFRSDLSNTDDYRVLIGAARARSMEKEGVAAA